MDPRRKINKIHIFVLAWFVFFILFGIFISNADAGIQFNKEETDLMNIAWQAGRMTEHPEVLQAILLNESVAGRFGRIGDKNFKNWHYRSYGVMQIQFMTAKKMGHSFNDKELLSMLTYNDTFNIYTGAFFFKKLLRIYGGNWRYAALAYNVGPKNVNKHGLFFDPNNYIEKIEKHLKDTIYKFNDNQGNKLLIVYKIKKGDTLSKIAKNLLGDWRKWKEIHALNSWIIPTKMNIGDEILISK